MIAVFLMRKLERLQVLNLSLRLKIRGNRSEPQTKASLLHASHHCLMDRFMGWEGGRGVGTGGIWGRASTNCMTLQLTSFSHNTRQKYFFRDDPPPLSRPPK